MTNSNVKPKTTTITKTFKELKDVDVLVGELFAKDLKLKSSKFGYAWKRFGEKTYFKHLKEYQHDISDARIDCAMEDKETKEVMRDPENSRGFKYTKDGLKKVMKKENEITEEWDKKEIDIEPYFISEKSLPEMSEEDKKLFKGLLIE